MFLPIKNINSSQNQGRFFDDKLSTKLNPKNKLYKLRDLINWSDLESRALSNVQIKQFGRNKKSHRMMAGTDDTENTSDDWLLRI